MRHLNYITLSPIGTSKASFVLKKTEIKAAIRRNVVNKDFWINLTQNQSFGIPDIFPIFAPRIRQREQKFPLFIGMTQQTSANHLETLIRSAFEEGRCGEYYIVDMAITPTHHIGVFIDGDEGVSLDTCTQISRILEAVLDAEPSLGGIYELEVSSPGVSRPLKFLRQYLKHVGRTLRIKMKTYDEVEGKLLSSGHDSITIEIPAKDKKSLPDFREIPFEDIKEAYVTVQFGKK